MLNQPDTERYMRMVHQLQDEAAKLVRKLDRLADHSQQAVANFSQDGTFSQEDCEAINPLQLSIINKLADLNTRAGILRGDSFYFLDEGMNEGDSPPCNC